MNKRDWAKDWEMCQCATPGPWVWDHNGFVYPTVDVSKMGFPRDWPPSLYKNDKVGKGPAICRAHHIELFETRKHDVNFITEAREALPYWLQRVHELEEAFMAMFGTTDVKKARSDLGGVLCRLEETEKYAEALEIRLEQLEAENCHLKTVAEAAKELIDWLRVDLAESTRAKKVRDALAKLEEVSNNG